MFGYNDLLHETELFCSNKVEVGSIGDSTLGQRIPYIFIGEKNGNYLIVQAAIHAREHMTALLAVCQAKYLVKNENLLKRGGIYFIPMVNPDGVRLCQEGLGFVTDKNLKNNLRVINGGNDFSLWKANANGVDLNVNFDAKWGQGEKNVFYASGENYIGKAPESEAETKALVNFTKKIAPVATLSYHLKGEVVYWDFGQTGHRRYRDLRYAKAIADYTGYSLTDSNSSCGGYKDWCVEKLKIPAYTVEVGSDEHEHPFPYSAFEAVLAENEDLPRRLLNTVVRDKEKLARGNLESLME